MGWLLAFSNPKAEAEQEARLQLTEHRSIHGHVIGVMANWLKGEDSAE